MRVIEINRWKNGPLLYGKAESTRGRKYAFGFERGRLVWAHREMKGFPGYWLNLSAGTKPKALFDAVRSAARKPRSAAMSNQVSEIAA